MAFSAYPAKGGIPSGNTAGRPAGAVIGDTYYNGELEILEIFNGTAWVANSAPPAVPTVVSVTDVGTGLAYATGGTLTVVVAPGTGGATALQYNALTTVGGFSGTSSSTTVSVGGLTPNTSFSVVANAQNNFGTTVNSNPFSSVLTTTTPQAPTIGTATASTSVNEVTVTWANGSTGGKNLSAITITPYLNGTTAETARTAATTSSTSYTFTEGQLTGGSSYTFKVSATNANGVGTQSAASNSATAPNFNIINYLVVAGGGGGGRYQAGAGGAGGLRSTVTATGGGGSLEVPIQATLSTNYAVTVGGGGSGSSGFQGGTGSNSEFSTITSAGGGGGGYGNGPTTTSGSAGGSGGGGYSANNNSGGGGTNNQGFAGGAGVSGNCGGGGGGAGEAGNTDGTGQGGDGVAVSITGSSVTYAGGGSGGTENFTTPRVAGDGGGGSGGTSNGTMATAGTTNLGGGGGGGAGSPDYEGRPGGSGVVILRYKNTLTITIGAGLTGSTATDGSSKVTTLTAGSGNVSWA